VREPRVASTPVDLAGAGVVRESGSARHAFSTALADPPRKGAIEPKEPKEPWQTSADLSRAVGESDNRTSSLPLAVAKRSLSTMSHSVAVIVARGADV